jgi:hypothetical protein
MGRALSGGTPAPVAAGWLEGFLEGGGLVLAHDDALLGILDAWVADLRDDGFRAVVPLVRRTFATFPSGERRRLAGRVRRFVPGAPPPDGEAAEPLDHERAAAALPLVVRLLGGGAA